MTIKKNTLKTMCAVLTCTTLLSGLLAANATDIIVTEGPMDNSVDSELDWSTEESNLEEIEVTYMQASSYSVSIPKAVALDANKQAAYSIKVTGSIDTNQRVYVAPVDGIAETEKIDFYMRDQTPDSKKSDVVANVTQNKYCWNSEEVANGYEEVNNSISAPDLTFGTWKGSLQMEIRLESIASHVHNYVDGVCTGCGEVDPNAEHTHNYIDGKCECGEIDPNHTHNYVDGVCTICGSEMPPASTSSYTWNVEKVNDKQIAYQGYSADSSTSLNLNFDVDGVYSTYTFPEGIEGSLSVEYKPMIYSTDMRFMTKYNTAIRKVSSSLLSNLKVCFVDNLGNQYDLDTANGGNFTIDDMTGITDLSLRLRGQVKGQQYFDGYMGIRSVFIYSSIEASEILMIGSNSKIQ